MTNSFLISCGATWVIENIFICIAQNLYILVRIIKFYGKILRPIKNLCVYTVTLMKKLGLVGRDFFYHIFSA